MPLLPFHMAHVHPACSLTSRPLAVFDDDVKVFKTTRLRLEPRGGGHIQLSGEQLKFPANGKAVEVELLPRAGRVMM